jgi:hypothetical protein
MKARGSMIGLSTVNANAHEAWRVQMQHGRGLWILGFGLAMVLAARVAGAEESVAVLTLEKPSFVSFQNEAMHGIPGGMIRFRLGSREPDGAIPFTIEPSDVQIPSFPIGRSAHGKYELVAGTSGVIRRGSSGLEITFPARIRATTIPAEGTRTSLQYDLVFTTARVKAMSADRSKSVAPQGKAVDETDGTVELVVATTNPTGAGTMPGAATFAYLVGRFDVVPGKTTPVAKAP